MSPDELSALTEDIANNGLLEPIVYIVDDDGERVLVDGRHRLQACEAAGVEPRFEEWAPPEGVDITTWVVSRNLHRRHLTASQRAMVAAELAEGLRPAARARQEATRARPGEQAHRRAPAILPGPQQASAGEVREQAASALGVSARSVGDALKVKRDAPELAEHIAAGKLTVSTAAEAAALPEPARNDFATAVASATDAKEAKRIARKLLKEERDAKRQAKQAERLAELEEKAAEAPPVDGDVQLLLGSVADLVHTVEGVDLVMADPPWPYKNQRINGSTDTHYSELSVDDIAADVDAAFDSAADDAYLALWVTMPMLEAWFAAAAKELEGGRQLRWEFVSGGAWGKTGRMGAGFHWRGDSEILLLYRKGAPKPLTTISNLHVGPRSAHSEKPVPWLLELIPCFCRRSGLVLDLYAGLAPTARACVTVGRRYVGIELDEKRHREATALLAMSVVDGGVR